MSKCFICSRFIPDNDKYAQDILSECPVVGSTLVKLISEIVDKTIPDEDLHSKVVCKDCHKSCINYDVAKKTSTNLKTKLLTNFKNGLPKFGLSYNTYPKKPPITPTKKVVVSASKLQPLPPDYVINVSKLPSSLSPEKLNLTKSLNVPSSPSIHIKVTAGSSLLTQAKPTVSSQKTITPEKSINNSITLSSILNSQSSSSTNSMLTFNVNSLPKDFLSSAVLTKIEDSDLKKENDNDEDINNDEQPMEIDEDCSLVRVAEDENNFDDENEEKSQEKSQYFDVSLLPLTDGSTNDTILGKLQILDHADGEEDDEVEAETIVMTGENGSILRIMSGQKLVYENGEISLATDDDNSNQDDNNDGHDSNDESQIELQVSGDEETANAIIAAAQEQGGAFIKVESGEMFRVKSVQSKPAGGSKEDNQALQMVGTEGDLFKCLLCHNSDKEDPLKLVISDAEQMMQHLKSEHDARIYICSICKKIMRKRIEYTAHIEEHSAKISKFVSDSAKQRIMNECPQCNKKYSSRTLLQEHMNIHNGNRPYSCSVCKKSFASKYTHQAHVKTHMARPRPFKCSQCSKSFFTQQNLNQHEKTHLGIKDFVCNVCGKAFGTQHNLEVHGVVHSGTKPFVCGVCAKAFARRAEVKDHMRIHTGERPFSCEVCGATFSQRSNLHSHRRATHLDDKRHHCTQCPKKFKRRRLLDYHIKASHTGERPLQCEICHATFVYPEHYKKHARIHSGEKPYVCEVCGKSFNSRDNRNTHRFVHSDKKPYECLVCGAGYMRKQLLYTHMNTSGHLAESIVVNQPRVQKVKGKVDENDQLTTVIEQPDELQLSAIESKSDAAPENDGITKLFLTADKKMILQDGKINLVQESVVDPTLLTFIQNLDGTGKSDGTLQGISAEQLGEHVQMVTSDENGAIRLVELHINANPATWTINQE
ncbi:zinc finger protein 711-like isoform X2 [Pectinophora gossypiella]|uniref:zinc finger protein 711-like isoform X2 n=1 Tax=Pectinophora gossypiella TaxID=13191 RepID=UPI00214F6096|nr:zinc finger protein 711-like isoform X2 [Pectinophora gossypiella]